MNEPQSWPPTFTLNQERILKLLTGDRFYSNASATLREAILNALDAILRRKMEDPTHSGSIRAVFDQTNLSLTVTDDGDGMNRAAVSSLFARIGSSAAQYDPRGSGAVGEFGIGVVSYFMSADQFEIETYDGSDEPIGLRFTKSMFAGGQAEEFRPARTERGTTLTLELRDESTYALLLDHYPHWCRDVAGLHAVEEPMGRVIPQGGDSGPEAIVEVALPSGIEAARIGPVSDMQTWDVMTTGASTVSILYRGVFVQEYTAAGVWGIEGSIHVDPKSFKPQLNREGFVGTEFGARIESFLRSAHPAVLSKVASLLGKAFEKGTVNKWSERRWATLWLSVPRNDTYANAAAKWDAIFRGLPAFELFQQGTWKPASVDDLVVLRGPLWVAPEAHARTDDLVKSATRLLRETGQSVVRGLSRESNWLRGAGNYFATTADLIRQVFSEELPEFRLITSEAETILESQNAIHTLYAGDEPVQLVNLGDDGPPILRVGRRLLINVEIDAGIAIVRHALDMNRGRHVLIEATAAYAPKYLQSVASIARVSPGKEREVLGLVRRRFVRELLR